MSDDSSTFKRIAIALEGIRAALEAEPAVVNNSTVIQRDGANYSFPSYSIQPCICENPDCNWDSGVR